MITYFSTLQPRKTIVGVFIYPKRVKRSVVFNQSLGVRELNRLTGVFSEVEPLNTNMLPRGVYSLVPYRNQVYLDPETG